MAKGDIVGIKITIDDKEALAELSRLEKRLRDLTSKQWVIKIKDGTKELEAKLDRISKKPIKPGIIPDTKPAEQQYERLRNQIQSRPIRIMTALGKAGGGILSVANTFSKMLNNPLSNAFRNVGATATSMLTTSVFNGISKIGERFDTFNLYKKQMKQMGAGTEEAEKAIHDLDDAVQGLPTSLSDITKEQKLFYSMTGDIDKATNLAIAANNAFLASGATASQREQGMKQINHMLSSGTLTGKQWISLANAMPGAIRQMGVTAKLSGKDLNRWVKDVTAGKRPVKEFLDLLEKAGTGDGLLVRQAAISKQSMSGWKANFETAIARLGQKTLDALDKSLKGSTGEGLVQHLYKINEGINKLAETIVKWVESHPDEIQKWLKRLQDFDWMGFARGMANAAKVMGNVIALAAKLPGGLLGFLIAGGGSMILKGIYPVGGLLKAIGQFGDMKAKMNQAAAGMESAAASSQRMGKAAKKTAGSFSGIKGATGKLKEGAASLGRFGRVMGKTAIAGAVVAEAVGVIYLAAKAFEKIAHMRIPFKPLQKNIGILLLSITEITGFFTGVGLLLTSTPIGWGATLAALIGGGVETGLVAAFWSIAKMLQSVAKVKVPTASKIKKVARAMNEAIKAMQSIELGLDWIPGRSAIKGGVMKGYVDSFGNIIKSLGEISKDIDKISSKGLGKKIKAVMIGENSPFKLISKAISEVTKEKPFEQIVAEVWESSSVKKAFDSIAGIVKDIATSVETLSNIKKDINKLTKKGFDPEKFKEKITNAFAIVQGVIEVVKGAFGQDVGLKTGIEIEASRVEDFKKLAENVSAAVTAVASIFTGTGSINSAYKTMLEAFGTKNKKGKVDPASWETVKQTIKTQIENISDLITELFGDRSTYGQKLRGASKTLKGVDMGNIATIFGDLVKAIKNLGKLHEVMTSMGNVFANKPSVGNGTNGTVMDGMFDSLGNMIDQMVGLANKISDPDDVREKLYAVRKMMASLVYAMGNFKNLTDLTAKADVSKTFSPVKSAVDALIEVSGKIADPETFRAKMYAIRMGFANLKLAMASATSMPKFDEGQSASSVSTDIATMITNVGNALKNAPDIQTQALGFSTAVTNIMNAVQDIMSGQYSIDNFVAALEKIPGALTRVSTAMNGKGKEWKSQLIGGFKGTASKILEYINNIATAIMTQVTGFYAAGRAKGLDFKNGFESGASGIQIPNGDGTTTTVQTGGRTFTSDGKVIHDAWENQFATGGQVHGAGGIDNVPAKLTNGEFVHRTAAVKMFGTDFMNKVNSLDVRGAFNALSSRVGAKLMGGTTVHNYNNQKVVQHIHTNNEKWSYMRANRFVRGLS